MEVEDAAEPDKMGCERVQFGVPSTGMEAGLGSVGGLFLPPGLDDGASRGWRVE